jgi:hypothetical protein
MPEMIENKLKAQARKRGLKGEEADKYVYGTLRSKFGWKPKSEKKE